jgi:hypothetical protein
MVGATTLNSTEFYCAQIYVSIQSTMSLKTTVVIQK